MDGWIVWSGLASICPPLGDMGARHRRRGPPHSPAGTPDLLLLPTRHVERVVNTGATQVGG